MMAIQVLQGLVRDARVREQAHIIQTEVQKLVEDVSRLGDRVKKLDTHFRQASEDVALITTSTDKIVKRGERIDQLDFEAIAPASGPKLIRDAAE
jgi:DNA recombination protein RmuC